MDFSAETGVNAPKMNQHYPGMSLAPLSLDMKLLLERARENQKDDPPGEWPAVHDASPRSKGEEENDHADQADFDYIVSHNPQGLDAEEEKNILVISITSAGYSGGNFAEIKINDEAVTMDKTETNHLRGLHIVVVNAANGKVEVAKVFDTYKSSSAFEKFIDHSFPEGFIILAACQDDCVTKLSQKSRNWFVQLGSKEILKLKYRQGFAFIGISGRKEANESRSARQKDSALVKQVVHLNPEVGKEEPNIDYYLTKGGCLEEGDRFKIFNDWCKEEGVVMPKLEYPATFEDGVVGVRCKADIQNREAYLFIPYKMIFSVRKVKENPILEPIIDKYRHCFSKSKTAEWDHLTLTLGLFYEVSKGKSSYWYPYLRQIFNIKAPSIWKEDQLEMIQDFHCMFDLQEQDQKYERVWELFRPVLEQNSDIFPRRLMDQNLFYIINHQVRTRCFGAGLSSPSMIPMADNHNHSSVPTAHELMNLSLHLHGPSHEEYFNMDRYLVDYSEVFRANDWTDEKINNNQNVRFIKGLQDR